MEPEAKPKINRKLFQKVYDLVVAEPEFHDQADWEQGDEGCGTTRCVGGWALIIHTGESTVVRAAGVVGANHDNIRGAARTVLGLTYQESTYLFYSVDNAEAVELCRRYATGGRASADRFIKSLNL